MTVIYEMKVMIYEMKIMAKSLNYDFNLRDKSQNNITLVVIILR